MGAVGRCSSYKYVLLGSSSSELAKLSKVIYYWSVFQMTQKSILNFVAVQSQAI